MSRAGQLDLEVGEIVGAGGQDDALGDLEVVGQDVAVDLDARLDLLAALGPEAQRRELQLARLELPGQVSVEVGARVEEELADEPPEKSAGRARLVGDADVAGLYPLAHHVAQPGVERLSVIGIGRLDVPEVVRIVGPEAEAVVAALFPLVPVRPPRRPA